MPQAKKTLKKQTPTPNVENPPKNSLLGVYNSTSAAQAEDKNELAVNGNVTFNGRIRQIQSGSLQPSVDEKNELAKNLNSDKAAADFAGFTLDWLKQAAVNQAKYERNHTKDGNEIPTGAYTPLTEKEIQDVERKALEFASTVPYDAKSPITSMENILEKAEKDGLVTPRSCEATLNSNKERIEVAALKTGLAEVKDFRQANSKPSTFAFLEKATGFSQGGYYGTVRESVAREYALKAGVLYSETMKDAPEVAEYMKGFAKGSTEAEAFAIGAGKGGYCYSESQKNPGDWQTGEDGVIRSKAPIDWFMDRLNFKVSGKTVPVMNVGKISDGLQAVAKAPQERAERFARYEQERKAREAREVRDKFGKGHSKVEDTKKSKRKQIDVSGVEAVQEATDEIQAD